MNQISEKNSLAPGVRITLSIILASSAFSFLLRFLSENFNAQNEVPAIFLQLIFLSPVAWLLIKPAKVIYQAVLAVVAVSFTVNIYKILTSSSTPNFAPVIINLILAAYLYTSYKKTYNAPLNASAKRIYDMARDADFKKDYADARRLYHEVISTSPGSLEAELSAEALKFLPQHHVSTESQSQPRV